MNGKTRAREVPRYFMTQATIDETNRIAKEMLEKLRRLREIRKIERAVWEVKDLADFSTHATRERL